MDTIYLRINGSNIPLDQWNQYTLGSMDPIYLDINGSKYQGSIDPIYLGINGCNVPVDLGISGYWIQYTWNQCIQYTYLGSMHPIYLWIITSTITDINGSNYLRINLRINRSDIPGDQ